MDNQQVDPSSVDDPALAARLGQFKTLSMSSKQLLDAYPCTETLAKKEGIIADQTKAENSAKSPGRPPSYRRQCFRPRPVGTIQNSRAAANCRWAIHAVYSNRQLEAVMADFWFIDFNVYANKGAVRLTLTSYERDVIRPHAIGQFDDLLIETAKSPRDVLLPRQLALR
jgi:uncharacterized protein (DUF1800 family)